jgi:hypothetical protein
MLESFLGGFVICQLLWKLLKTDNAFLKCFIGGFLVRILLEEQRTSFDVYCQFTFFVLNQAYVIYVFALPFILLLGSFPPGRLVLLVRWTTYVIYDLGIVMALVFFTLCFHFTIWVYNPFLTIPEFRGKCPMHSVLWWSVSLLFCVVQFQHTCLFNLAFFVVTTCSLIFWLIMIFLIHVLYVQNRYL